MRPHGSCTRGPSKRFNIFNEVNTTNLHISSHVHDAVLLFCISPFTNGPTTNETIQKSSCLWQKLCSLLSKVRRWLLQTWKPWWWLKALSYWNSKLLASLTPNSLEIYRRKAPENHPTTEGKNIFQSSSVGVQQPSVFAGEVHLTRPRQHAPLKSQAFFDFAANIFSREPFSAAWGPSHRNGMQHVIIWGIFYF